jgi:pimeloyl-ACP methyl ester carboxylesterase
VAVALALVAVAGTSACSGDDDQGAAVTEATATTLPTTVAGAGGASETSAAADSGASSVVETFTVDGVDIDVVLVVPPGEPTDTEVVFAFPPGGQDLELTKRIVEQIYAEQALARGWIVASPAAPNGELFYSGSDVLVPGLLEQLAERFQPHDGKFQLVGVSNGGLSAFRAARLAFDRFASISTYPGYPGSEEDREILDQLATIPVRLYVGGDDTGWRTPMEALEQELRDLGGDVQLTAYPGEGHIIEPLRDGEILFDNLDQIVAGS